MYTMEDVKTLRERTGAGISDCSKALKENDGDMEKAIDYLREKGIAKAAKKESRIAAEGLANVYINGNKAIILEVNSETDFVSKNEEFRAMIDTIGETLLKSDVKTVEEAKKYILRDVQDVIEYYKNINDEINLIKLKKIIDWIGEY